ncbi:MAG: hypothetical protein ACR2NL_12320 [Acidimicrobiia bacterium]
MLARALISLMSWVLVLGVVACGGSDDQPEASESTSTPDTASAAWDLLYIQDSGGARVAELYAERARQSLGVEINVHNNAIANLSAITILENMRGASGTWPDLVREAEIIVLFGSPVESGATSDLAICRSTSTEPREPPTHNSAEDWQPYRDALNEIYAEIWKLRAGEPVILRAVDDGNPVISDWREAGIEPECTMALEAMNQTIREAAEANGATLVSTYDLFNGADHQEDPREKGYIGSDGIHTTIEGATAIADALAAAGYEPTTGP